jgi:hypothetical protein
MNEMYTNTVCDDLSGCWYMMIVSRCIRGSKQADQTVFRYSVVYLNSVTYLHTRRRALLSSHASPLHQLLKHLTLWPNM